MLQSAKVTAFTVSQLLRENQQGGRITSPSPTQIRVNLKIEKKGTQKIITVQVIYMTFQKQPPEVFYRNRCS